MSNPNGPPGPCETHPTYRALRRPRVLCPICWRIYLWKRYGVIGSLPVRWYEKVYPALETCRKDHVRIRKVKRVDGKLRILTGPATERVMDAIEIAERDTAYA